MQETLFLGKKGRKSLQIPELELKDAQRLTEFVDLSSYYCQPTADGLRYLEGVFEVINTGKDAIIYDAVVPGSFVARRNTAYSSKNVKKYKISTATLVAANNATSMVWDFLESGYTGAYFRSAYGSYDLSPLYYVDEVFKGEIKVFSVTENEVTGIMNDQFVTVTVPADSPKPGSKLSICWIQHDDRGNPHNPIVISGASHPR